MAQPHSSQQPSAAERPAQDDSAVEFLAAIAPADKAVRRRAFAALLRAVTRETQPR